MRQTICVLKTLGFANTAKQVCIRSVEISNILTLVRTESRELNINLTREMIERIEITALNETGVKLKGGYYV